MYRTTRKRCPVTFCVATVVLLNLNCSLFSQEAVGAQDLAEGKSKARKKVEQLKPLMRDGKPFFVIGAYGVPKDTELKTLREAGWNTVLEEELGNASAEAIQQRLSEFNNAGLVGIVGLHD